MNWFTPPAQNCWAGRNYLGSVANFTWGMPEYDRWKLVQRNSTMIEFKGSHFERDVILWGVPSETITCREFTVEG